MRLRRMKYGDHDLQAFAKSESGMRDTGWDPDLGEKTD